MLLLIYTFFRVSVFVFLSFELTNFFYSSAIYLKLSVSVCMCERRGGILFLPIPRYSLFIRWLGNFALSWIDLLISNLQKDHSKKIGLYSHVTTDDHFVCHVSFTTKFFMSYIPFRGVAGFPAYISDGELWNNY